MLTTGTPSCRVLDARHDIRKLLPQQKMPSASFKRDFAFIAPMTFLHKAVEFTQVARRGDLVDFLAERCQAGDCVFVSNGCAQHAASAYRIISTCRSADRSEHPLASGLSLDRCPCWPWRRLWPRRAVRKLSPQASVGLPAARQASQKARIRVLAAALMRARPSGVCLPDLIWPPWPKQRGRVDRPRRQHTCVDTVVRLIEQMRCRSARRDSYVVPPFCCFAFNVHDTRAREQLRALGPAELARPSSFARATRGDGDHILRACGPRLCAPVSGPVQSLRWQQAASRAALATETTTTPSGSPSDRNARRLCLCVRSAQ